MYSTTAVNLILYKYFLRLWLKLRARLLRSHIVYLWLSKNVEINYSLVLRKTRKRKWIVQHLRKNCRYWDELQNSIADRINK